MWYFDVLRKSESQEVRMRNEWNCRLSVGESETAGYWTMDFVLEESNNNRMQGDKVLLEDCADKCEVD